MLGMLTAYGMGGIIILCMLGSGTVGFMLWLLWLLLMPSTGMSLVVAASVLPQGRQPAFQPSSAGHLQAAKTQDFLLNKQVSLNQYSVASDCH